MAKKREVNYKSLMMKYRDIADQAIQLAEGYAGDDSETVKELIELFKKLEGKWEGKRDSTWSI
jgi:hypothetical protein